MSRERFDRDTEMQAVAEMLAVAERKSLQVEVVLSFVHMVETGADILNAARYALEEWDLS